MRHELVRIDAESLCGDRFVPAADVELPTHVAVHRITTWAGAELPCSPAEAQAWDDAARACLGLVSRALERMYRAHGGRHAEIDLASGARSWLHVSPPLWSPGAQRRSARRSAAAQRRFVAEVATATPAYGPVHEHVAGLVEQADAAGRAAELRRAVLVRELARRRCWVVRADGGAVRVGMAAGTAGALTAAELEQALAATRAGERAEPVWDPEARAELERECRDAGVAMTFPQWWDAATEGRWRRRHETRQQARHATSHHSSYGVGGHSSFGTSF